MKSLCLFASFFESESVPYYIHVYLAELKKHFDEVYFLTSKKELSQQDLQSLQSNSIPVLFLENKGFDFGLWYQAIQHVDIRNYQHLALVNDSCVLFKSLDGFFEWARKESSDIQGMTRSEAIFPHLQSYFLLLNQSAIPLLNVYFDEHKVLSDISDVIRTYEVGLSRFWSENGLRLSAFVDNNGYVGEFSPYYYCVNYHLQQGIPLIKKKIIYSSYRKEELNTLARMNFNINPEYYFRLLADFKDKLIINLEILKSERAEMSYFRRITYNFKRFLILLLRPVYKSLKRV